jgi:integrase/recombinase XerD
MEQIIVYTPHPKAGRCKVFIPYAFKSERELFKKLDTSFYHPTQKLWSIVNSPNNLVKLKSLFGLMDLKEATITSISC